MDDIPHQITQYTDQSLSAIHHALRSSRRRLILGLVGHRVITASTNQQFEDSHQAEIPASDAIPVRQLAKEIAAIEDNVPIENATGETYHNAYTALIQTHLPHLDNLSAIKYDDDRKRIRPDQNLIPLAMVAAITSPMAQMLYHNAISNHDLGGPQSQ